MTMLTIGSELRLIVTAMGMDKSTLVINAADESGSVYEVRGPVGQMAQAPRKAPSSPAAALAASQAPEAARAPAGPQEPAAALESADLATTDPHLAPVAAPRTQPRIDPWLPPEDIARHLAEFPEELESFIPAMSLRRRRLTAEHLCSILGDEVKRTSGYKRLVSVDPEPEVAPDKTAWGVQKHTAARAELGADQLGKRLRREDRQTVTVDDFLAQEIRMAPRKGDSLTPEDAARELENARKRVLNTWK